MRYYLVAGEASGDLHGSLLIRALKNLDLSASFRFVGGRGMKEASGLEPFLPVEKLSFMGFLEVARHVSTIIKNLNQVSKDIEEFNPDALILIDFPGFNLRLASKAHNLKISTYYYISPKVWAWNSKRILKIKKVIDHMLVIFPFEVDFYRKWGMEVDYVGNPIMDALTEFQKNRVTKALPISGENERPIIALLPGSRKQEIDRILPIMLEIIPDFPNYQFVVAGASGFSADYYEPYIFGKDILVVFDQTYSLLMCSTLALVTSGTATLETALLGIPEVVLYKTSRLSYEIGKRVIRVPYISLVNLIMDTEVVQELIQQSCNAVELKEAIRKIISGQPGREKMMAQFEVLKKKVGGPGASHRASEQIFSYLQSPIKIHAK